MLKIRGEIEDTTLRVALAGEFDLSSVAAFRAEVARAGDRCDEICLDLRDVAFMDSSGLQEMVALNNRARERGLRLALVAPSHPVRRLLELTGLEEHFDVRD